MAGKNRRQSVAGRQQLYEVKVATNEICGIVAVFYCNVCYFFDSVKSVCTISLYRNIVLTMKIICKFATYVVFARNKLLQ